jgi:hypothetical protein
VIVLEPLVFKIIILSLLTVGLPFPVAILALKSSLDSIYPLNKVWSLLDLRSNLYRALSSAHEEHSNHGSGYLEACTDYIVTLTSYSDIEKKYKARSGHNVIYYMAVLFTGTLPFDLSLVYFRSVVPTIITIIPLVVYYLLLFLYCHIINKHISRFVPQYPGDYSAAKKVNVPQLSFDAPTTESDEHYRALESARQELDVCAFCMNQRMEKATISRALLLILLLSSNILFALFFTLIDALIAVFKMVLI